MAFQNEVAPNRDDRHQGRLAYLTDDLMPKETTGLLWQTAQESSLVLRLGRQVPVGYGETVIPMQSVEPEVGQVGVGTRPQDREGYRKPVSGIAWDSTSFAPIKLATIVTASEEFARANVNGMWSNVASQMAAAVGRGIDLAVFQGKRPDNGDALLGISTNGYVNLAPNPINYPTTTDTLDVDLTKAWATLVDRGYNPNAWAIDARFVPPVLTARDANNNLLFQGSLNLAQNSLGSLAGLPVQQGRAVSGTVGRGEDTGTRAVLGDWTRLVYGYADQVRMKVTDTGVITSADGTQVNLWQTNQVAVLIETTFGWLVDPNAFVRLTDTAGIVAGTTVPEGEEGGDAVVTEEYPIGGES
jgi:HK97 family phage major capsid protein